MMSLCFSGTKQIGPGAWLAPLTPNDVRRFGQNVATKGGRSVIGVESPRFDGDNMTLTVALNSIFALNIGQENEAVIVDLKGGQIETEKPQPVDPALVTSVDKDFFASCSVHLAEDEDKVGIISRVLSEVRKHYDDKLVEGKGRKWTASPHNFLAITIQNRNKQFLVSVNADPVRFSFKQIVLKRSRPPYCEFHLNSQSQIDEAIEVILSSAQYR